jgi:hypothetical protein
MSVREFSSLTLGLVLGPIVALINQQAIYSEDAWACGHDARGILHIIPLVCLIAVFAVALSAYNDWRRAGRGVEDEHGGVAARTRFVSMAGLAISALSMAIIIAQWFAVIMFGPCLRA